MLAKELQVIHRLIQCLGAEGKMFLSMRVPSTELPNNGSQAIELFNAAPAIITGTL